MDLENWKGNKGIRSTFCGRIHKFKCITDVINPPIDLSSLQVGCDKIHNNDERKLSLVNTSVCWKKWEFTLSSGKDEELLTIWSLSMIHQNQKVFWDALMCLKFLHGVFVLHGIFKILKMNNYKTFLFNTFWNFILSWGGWKEWNKRGREQGSKGREVLARIPNRLKILFPLPTPEVDSELIINWLLW